MTANDTIETLNELIETSKDGEYGFRTSAEHATDARLKQLLAQRADECAQAARELQQEVVALGGKPRDDGTAAGAMHRGWVSVKSKMSTYSDQQILEEVERGEDHALNKYQKAVSQQLSGSAGMLVARQLEGVRRNHDQMRALRDAAKTSSAAAR
jgi:uncharacterized protein (TIGR02284 family)